jgi:hypothetical protein
MPITRKVVGKPEAYRGRTITARHMGPDLLGYVDDIELSGFFIDVEAVRSGGQRYIDAEIKAKEDAETKAQRARA